MDSTQLTVIFDLGATVSDSISGTWRVSDMRENIYPLEPPEPTCRFDGETWASGLDDPECGPE